MAAWSNNELLPGRRSTGHHLGNPIGRNDSSTTPSSIRTGVRHRYVDRTSVIPRWFSITISAVLYLEMAIGACFIKMPEPQQPDIWKKMEPLPWVKGPYDDDSDFCWVDDRTGVTLCWEEHI